MADDNTAISIGIVGCANIARKLCRAIALAPNAKLTAVASRDLSTAINFANANNLPPSVKLFGSYESLLDDSTIDAVYLPLPTALRSKWACVAARKKKHILLEKPVAMNVKEFDEIVAECEANGVQLMDCTMWLHHPRTKKMSEFLRDDDRFGKLKTVHSTATVAADADFLANNIRMKRDLDGLGALGIGWYCAAAILWAADYHLPKTVLAMPNPKKNEVGVILACGAWLQWEDGETATFYCSFLDSMASDITAIGEKGTLHVFDFIIPCDEKEAEFTSASKTCFNELSTGWNPLPSRHCVFADLPQETGMVEEFAGLVGRIKKEGAKPDQTWPRRSRMTQVILDAVISSIDRNFVPVELPISDCFL